MVRRPETSEETRSFPAREVTMALWAPETQGLFFVVVVFVVVFVDYRGWKRWFSRCEQ